VEYERTKADQAAIWYFDKQLCGYNSSLVYTQDELNCSRYHKGVVEEIVLPEDKANLQDFYRISNAYEALNILLYPGVSSKQVCIVDEQRRYTL